MPDLRGICCTGTHTARSSLISIAAYQRRSRHGGRLSPNRQHNCPTRLCSYSASGASGLSAAPATRRWWSRSRKRPVSCW